MKRFVLAITLTCALAATALAGEVPTTGITAPPPSEPSSPTTLPGEIPTGDYELEPMSGSDLVAALLSILNAAL